MWGTQFSSHIGEGQTLGQSCAHLRAFGSASRVSEQQAVPRFRSLTHEQLRLQNYFIRQLRLQVSTWESHELKHGVLKVAGHARLQDAFWVEQFDTHMSVAASANLNLLALIAPPFADAASSNTQRIAVARVNFMSASSICDESLRRPASIRRTSIGQGLLDQYLPTKIKSTFSNDAYRLMSITFCQSFIALLTRCTFLR